MMLQGPQVSQYARGLVAQQEAQRRAAESAEAIGSMVRQEEIDRFLRRKALEEKTQLLEAARRQEKLEQHEMLMSSAGEMAQEEQSLLEASDEASIGDLADIIQAKVYGSDEVLPLLQARNEKQSMYKQSNEGGGVAPMLAGAGLLATGAGGALALKNPAARAQIMKLLARFGAKADDALKPSAKAAQGASDAAVAAAARPSGAMAALDEMPSMGQIPDMGGMPAIPGISKTSFWRRGIGNRSEDQLGLVGIGNEETINEYLLHQTPNTTGDRVRDAILGGGSGALSGALVGGVNIGIPYGLLRAAKNRTPILAGMKRLGRKGAILGGALGLLGGAAAGAINPTPNISVFDPGSGAQLDGHMSRKERRSIIDILNRLRPGEQEDNFNIMEGDDLGRPGRNLDALVGYGVDLDEAMEEDPMLQQSLMGEMEKQSGVKVSAARKKARGYALEKASEFALASVLLAAQGRERKAERARKTSTQIVERLLK